MIKLISFVKTLWLPQEQLCIWPSIGTGFLRPGSMVYFSGKRSMENVEVDSKDGTKRPLPPGVHALV